MEIKEEYSYQCLHVMPEAMLEKKYKKIPALMEEIIREMKKEYWSLLPALQLLSPEMVVEPISELATDGEKIFYHPAAVWSAFQKGDKKAVKNLYIHRILHLLLHGLLGHFSIDREYTDRKLCWAVMDFLAEKFYQSCFGGEREESYDFSPFLPPGLAASQNEARLNQLLEKGMGGYYVLRDQKKSREFFFNRLIKSGGLQDNHYIWHQEGESGRGRESISDPNSREDEEGTPEKEKEEAEKSKEGKKGKEGTEKSKEGKKQSQEEARAARIEKAWQGVRMEILGSGCDAKKLCEMSFQELGKLLESSIKQAGCGAGGAEEGYQAKKDSRMNYADTLRKLCREKESSLEEPDSIDPMFYHYGLELYGDVPLIEPLEDNPKLKLEQLILAIDTSGSCAGEVAERFLGETYKLLSDGKALAQIRDIYLVECDYKVQKVTRFQKPEEMLTCVENMRLNGFGGTSFVPVFEWIHQMKKKKKINEVSALFYLTDGFGEFPKEKADYPTYFVMPEEDYEQTEMSEYSWIKPLILERS